MFENLKQLKKSETTKDAFSLVDRLSTKKMLSTMVFIDSIPTSSIFKDVVNGYLGFHIDIHYVINRT